MCWSVYHSRLFLFVFPVYVSEPINIHIAFILERIVITDTDPVSPVTAPGQLGDTGKGSKYPPGYAERIGVFAVDIPG